MEVCYNSEARASTSNITVSFPYTPQVVVLVWNQIYKAPKYASALFCYKARGYRSSHFLGKQSFHFTSYKEQQKGSESSPSSNLCGKLRLFERFRYHRSYKYFAYKVFVKMFEMFRSTRNPSYLLLM